ncbi:hypothetical protein [Bosea sp. Root381]|uniref:hypothetical protein n=1 Tax=Bosea sp. Root381 TaxID=1736524 RepID=UPI001FCD458E|nr:hypothetical protein [Bosea sp. Root381]
MAELLGHLLLRGQQNAVIMFSVLEVIFSSNRIARRLRVARQLQILLRNVLSGTADFDIRPVRLVAPLQRVRRLPVSAAVIVVVIIVVTAAHAPVLTWSHSRLSRALCSRQPWGHHARSGVQRVAALRRVKVT